MAGFLFLDRAKFAASFAADVSPDTTSIIANAAKSVALATG